MLATDIFSVANVAQRSSVSHSGHPLSGWQRTSAIRASLMHCIDSCRHDKLNTLEVGVQGCETAMVDQQCAICLQSLITLDSQE